LPKSSISVDSSVATDLSDEATRQGKTLYGFANECMRSIISVCKEGGIPQEIYPSWKLAKMSKDFGGTPLFSRELIEAVVKLAYSSDKKKLLEVCGECGKNFGIFLSVNYPKREDLIKLVDQLQFAFPSRVTELKSVRDENDEDRVRYVFRYISTLSKEMTECMESYLKGMFGAYSLRPTSSKIGLGIIELQFEPV
ncbi:MAG: hypothetical protein ACREBS_02295, partial [Nitrososphaerales archaeon]